ncbi:MAG: zinc-binding dehydrogenase [Pseudomonadales bacterium]|jgi:NADPH2:quinone reductase|nr:zinc-binding dehydrogenase [Pseudomonadales bacterium]MDP7596226.1 zinc-binding dehydrogenase [Pseudomonadales bacterium]HJN49452.1 zinc-binding dehydrogenase [Pseudomonadales bacterium]|tara:strand:- start:706 stop:1848 length:1143 start_codon:yes stop_codon:yes gene_type:complete
MPQDLPDKTLQIHSLVTEAGNIELSLVSSDVKQPDDNEVVVRIEATPINPSDLGLLFGAADKSTVRQTGTATDPVITVTIPEPYRKAMAPRLNQSLPAGNEGAGIVVATGSSDESQALIGKTVGIIGGAMYGQYRTIAARDCLVLRDGTTPYEGASCFVNPLTALGMVGTMRMEGHTALLHTAAASNLGQMLVKICLQDGVDLVNIVRKEEHVTLLKELGAKYVCDSSAPSFKEDLTDQLTETGATIGFDATGGGKLAGYILAAMEAAVNRRAGAEFNRYGSATHKQVYIYGGLETSPTQFNRNFGMSWGIGGWLLGPFLQKVGSEGAQKLRDRVAAEIKTTFKSTYTKEVSLIEALQVESVQVYGSIATGQKYLINPHK